MGLWASPNNRMDEPTWFLAERRGAHAAAVATLACTWRHDRCPRDELSAYSIREGCSITSGRDGDTHQPTHRSSTAGVRGGKGTGGTMSDRRPRARPTPVPTGGVNERTAMKGEWPIAERARVEHFAGGSLAPPKLILIPLGDAPASACAARTCRKFAPNQKVRVRFHPAVPR